MLGLAGCVRHSELVALGPEDVTVHRDRLTVTARRWKADQDACSGRALYLR